MPPRWGSNVTDGYYFYKYIAPHGVFKFRKIYLKYAAPLLKNDGLLIGSINI
jgi:hypothetical protein